MVDVAIGRFAVRVDQRSTSAREDQRGRGVSSQVPPQNPAGGLRAQGRVPERKHRRINEHGVQAGGIQQKQWEHKQKGAEGEEMSEASRTIGSGITIVRETPGGKKSMGEKMVTGMRSSMHATQGRMREARDAREKEKAGIRVVNERMKPKRENAKKWSEPAMPKKQRAWGNWVSRRMSRYKDDIENHEDEELGRNKANNSLVTRYRKHNTAHNRLVDGVGEGPSSSTSMGTQGSKHSGAPPPDRTPKAEPASSRARIA